MSALIVDHKWRVPINDHDVVEDRAYGDRPCGYNGTCGKHRTEHERASGRKLDRCPCGDYDPVRDLTCTCGHGRAEHVTPTGRSIGHCRRELP